MERSTKLFDITRGYRLGIFPAYQGRADPWQWRPCMPWPLPRLRGYAVLSDGAQQWRKPTTGGIFYGQPGFSIWSFRGGNRKISWWVILVRLNWLSWDVSPIFRQSLVRQKSSNLGEIFIPMTTKSSKYWDLYSISFLRKCQVFTNEVKRFLESPTGILIKIYQNYWLYHGIYESLWIDILLWMISDIDRHLDCLWSSRSPSPCCGPTTSAAEKNGTQQEKWKCWKVYYGWYILGNKD